MTTGLTPGVGRISKLDDAMITALSELVLKGNYYHDACAICGISEASFYYWIQLAKADEAKGLPATNSIYLRFSEAIQKARADSRAQFVAVIHEAATVKREWLPAITYLERTDPAHWGRRDRQDVNINETKTITITRVTVIESAEPPCDLVEGEARDVTPRLLENNQGDDDSA